MATLQELMRQMLMQQYGGVLPPTEGTPTAPVAPGQAPNYANIAPTEIYNQPPTVPTTPAAPYEGMPAPTPAPTAPPLPQVPGREPSGGTYVNPPYESGGGTTVPTTPTYPTGQIAPTERTLLPPMGPPGTAPNEADPYQDGTVPAWWTRNAPDRPTGVGLADYMQQYVTNMLIPYLDPRTQWETAGWLGRDNPATWGQTYGSVPTSDVPKMAQSGAQYIDPARLTDIMKNLNYQNIVAALPASVQGGLGGTEGASAAEKEANRQAGLDAQAGLKWLTEALRTAQKGMGKSATRSNQLWAGKHLNTLMTEAQAEPNTSGRYTTLFENIVNPITQRAPLSGIFGKQRALVTPSAFTRKGLVSRNPALT